MAQSARNAQKVLEGVAESLARELTAAVAVPTIGIGLFAQGFRAR
jgi:ketopantoate hydroxymethyltransferase